MKTLYVVAAAALAIASCDDAPVGAATPREQASPTDVREISALTCPERQGELMRLSVTANECRYSGPAGAEVSLRLVRIADGGADSSLRPLQAELQAIVPPPPASRPPAPPSPPRAPARDDVDINLPGFSVKANDDGARIRMPGMDIDAQGDDATVQFSGGGEQVHVNSTGGATEVRVQEGGDEVQSTYILSREQPTESGWQLAGYRARGPRSGPLVVAVARARQKQSHELFDDLEDLVDRSFRR